jgi:hypothetical protein
MLWGTTPAWTAKFIVPFGSIDLLGWLETATPLVRQVVAIIVTAAINIAAVRWVLKMNLPAEEQESDETLFDALEQQTA